MKRVLLLLILTLMLPRAVLADYTLPYPSYMPGNKLYKISRFFDTVQKYWYWGNIASVKYHLKLADKYLVEAKTLFEYRQYLLGVDALRRSNEHLPFINKYLILVLDDGKDAQKLKELVTEAMNVHLTMLEKMSIDLPSGYQWTPEKQPSTEIHFIELFQEARKIRAELRK